MLRGKLNGKGSGTSEETVGTPDKLKNTFENIPYEINLILFTSPDKNDHFNQATKNVLRIFTDLTPKIKLHVFDINHKEAKKLQVQYTPALFFNIERYQNIRWYGAPIGEETRTLVEALIIVGYGETHISQDSKNILNRISSPRKIKIFVSPTCPYCPQQAINALKAAIEKPEFITLEIIDIQANPDLAEKYSAQSVPQVYSGEKLIALGAQPEELFMLSLEKMEQQTIFIPDSDAKEVEADLVIVGGGPAGLTAGIYGARSGLKTVIIEKNILGGQVANTPIIENYPGINQIGGKALVDLMVSHALEYVKIFPGEEVLDIQKGDLIDVQSNKRHFISKALLLATGAEYRRINVPGESRLTGRGVSYCSTCDGPLFKGKKVLMAGGGDSAVTEALHLHNLGVDVTVVHRRDRLRAQEHLVKNILSNDIPVVYNTEINESRGEERV
jgi:thioredoxin reductase (NADPH)